MTYAYFKQMNDISKGFADVKGKVIDVDFKANICRLVVEGEVKDKMTISSLIEDIVYNEMGAITNPSALKNWKGFDENQHKNLKGSVLDLTWQESTPIERRQQAFDCYLSKWKEQSRKIDSKEAFKEV